MTVDSAGRSSWFGPVLGLSARIEQTDQGSSPLRLSVGFESCG